jgi:hypothetical protein
MSAGYVTWPSYRGHDDVQPLSPFFQATCSMCRPGPGPSAPHEHPTRAPAPAVVAVACVAAARAGQQVSSTAASSRSRSPICECALLTSLYRPRWSSKAAVRPRRRRRPKGTRTQRGPHKRKRRVEGKFRTLPFQIGKLSGQRTQDGRGAALSAAHGVTTAQQQTGARGKDAGDAAT